MDAKKNSNFENMKTIRVPKKKLSIAFLLVFLAAISTSCVVTKNNGANNGKKKGWFKSTKNPHNPNTTNKKATKNKN